MRGALSRRPSGVDGDHDALGAETLRRFADEFRAVHGRRVDGNLVRTGIEEIADIGQLPHPAADGQRHEDPLGGAGHHVENDAALFVRGGDVEKGQFVRPLGVIGLGRLHRVAGVAQLDELHPLDHPAVFDVETGDNALGQHGISSSARTARLVLCRPGSDPFKFFFFWSAPPRRAGRAPRCRSPCR